MTCVTIEWPEPGSAEEAEIARSMVERASECQPGTGCVCGHPLRTFNRIKAEADKQARIDSYQFFDGPLRMPTRWWALCLAWRDVTAEIQRRLDNGFYSDWSQNSNTDAIKIRKEIAELDEALDMPDQEAREKLEARREKLLSLMDDWSCRG